MKQSGVVVCAGMPPVGGLFYGASGAASVSCGDVVSAKNEVGKAFLAAATLDGSSACDASTALSWGFG